MKYIIFLFIIMLLLFSCNKQRNQLNVTVNNIIQYNNIVYEIKKKSQGIDKELKNAFGLEKEIIDYSIIVYKKNDRNIIQEIFLEDKLDKMISLKLDQSIFKNVIKLKFKFDKFATGSIDYSGNKLYKINEKTGKLELIFIYFDNIFSQDYPSIDLEKINVVNNNLELVYFYRDDVLFPELGNGDVVLKYRIDNSSKLLTFDSFSCNITRTMKEENRGISKDNHKFPPEEINLNKEQISKKFNKILNDYKLFF